MKRRQKSHHGLRVVSSQLVTKTNKINGKNWN